MVQLWFLLAGVSTTWLSNPVLSRVHDHSILSLQLVGRVKTTLAVENNAKALIKHVCFHSLFIDQHTKSCVHLRCGVQFDNFGSLSHFHFVCDGHRLIPRGVVQPKLEVFSSVYLLFYFGKVYRFVG
jgi:hypothetical protein